MKKRSLSKRIVLFADGGSRGNPGPAAVGVLVGDREYAEYIGETTNNIAEYKAVIFALKKLKELIGKEASKSAKVEVRIDSELVARQITGKYKILASDLHPVFIELWNLKQDFASVDFKLIPREENLRADRLVNQELDGHLAAKHLF